MEDSMKKVLADVLSKHQIEVEKRKEAEVQLLQMQQNYESFFNRIDEFLFVLDEEARIIHVNDTVLKRLEYSLEEMIGQPVVVVHPEARREEAFRIATEMLLGKMDYCPVPLITKSGVQIPVETRISHGLWNNKPALFGVSKDISRIVLSEEKFSKSFYINPVACGFTHPQTGIFVEVNKAFANLVELDTAEIIGHTAEELNILQPGQRKDLYSFADADGKVKNLEYTIHSKSGKQKEVVINIEKIFIQDQEYNYIIVDNVSDTKDAQRSLNQQMGLQNLLLKISSTYINIDFDKVDAVIQESMQEMCEFVGADRAYVFDYDFPNGVTNNSYEWCSEGTTPEIDNLQQLPIDFLPDFVDSHLAGKEFYIPNVYDLPDDGPSSLRGVLEPQGIKTLLTLPMILAGEVVGFVGFDFVRDFFAYSDKQRQLLEVFSQMLVNITDRKKKTIELNQARETAEEMSKLKEIFMATMSHEIRTPLNVIIGMIRELDREKLTSIQSNYLTHAKSSATHLLSIVNNVLDVTKIEAGELILHSGSFKLSKMLKDIESILLVKVKEKGLSFIVELDPKADLNYLGDENRIRQILINFIGNSIKFTENGFVSLRVFKLEDINGNARLKFEVTDTGIGISEEFMGKLFEQFTQEEHASNRRFEGTGLGMSISKELINLMGGDVHVHSIKGEGTTITFDLQLLKDDEIKVDEIFDIRNWDALNGKRILVVEDNELNRLIVRLSLQSVECKIYEAENGIAAIDLLKNKEFDLILMDIRMPLMDGIEATKHIRNQLKLDIPIIALTANVLKQDLENYIAAGMNDYVLKPYKEEDMFLTMEKNLFLKSKDQETLYCTSDIKSIGGSDPEFVKKMLTIFVSMAEDAIDNFKSFTEQGDCERIAKLAHKIKPSIQNLKIIPLIDPVKELENCNNNPDKADVYKKLDFVAKHLKTVTLQIQKDLQLMI